MTSDPVTTPTIDEVITPITEEEKEPISDDTQAIPTIEIEKSETCSNEEVTFALSLFSLGYYLCD